MRKPDKNGFISRDNNPRAVKKTKPEGNGAAHGHEKDYNDEDFCVLGDPCRPLYKKVKPSRQDKFDKRLGQLVSRLFPDKGPNELNGEQGFLWTLIACTFEASHLNKRDPMLATCHPFHGKVEFDREEMTNYTSIVRFMYDLEALLRELYGDVDGDDLVELLDAIDTIVVEFTRYARLDLYQEHLDAYEYDYGQAWASTPSLVNRAIQVSDYPDAYCWYTRKFVKALEKHWPSLMSWKPGSPHRLESTT